MKDTKRCFFALFPDAEAAKALSHLAEQLAHATVGRATPVERLHLTLAFLGDCSITEQKALALMAEKLVRQHHAFWLVADKLRLHERRGLAWLGVSLPAPALFELQQSLREMLRDACFELDEKRFKPHITLVRDMRRDPEFFPDFIPSHWNCQSLCLVSSELTSSGPVYSVVGRWPLLPHRAVMHHEGVTRVQDPAVVI
jgi:RNA 2',3'-cyclic 3'-phosphodiesterase